MASFTNWKVALNKDENPLQVVCDRQEGSSYSSHWDVNNAICFKLEGVREGKHGEDRRYTT